jgi:hypothetical protein
MCFSHLCIADNPFDICKTQICDVIVDSGYTGTRVHVYTLDPKTFNQDKKLSQIYEKKVNKSFISITPEDSEKILNELFIGFPQFTLNTYVYATASYRSMTFTKQIQFSYYIRKWFRKQAYLNLREVRNLSGQEEALYAWISNYFNHYADLKNKTSVGMIEVGGGSAQVAVNYFGVSPLSQVQNIYRFNWFDGKMIQLWVKSLSAYGREKMSKGLSCQAPMSIHHCVQQIYAKAKTIENSEVTEIQEMVNLEQDHTSWYGLGLLSYIGNSTLFNFKGSYSLNELVIKGQKEACEVSPDELNQKQDPFAHKTCFNTAYIYALTHELIGLPQNTVIHYYSEEDGQGWPQGIMIRRYIFN